MQEKDLRPTSRRNFLGTIAVTSAALGVSTFAAPLSAGAKTISKNLHYRDDPEEWFKKINGKHRMVFDVTAPNDAFPFAWPRVFLMTNEATGTPEKDLNVVVVLRHNAIPYAMADNMWAKYGFGNHFHINDHLTKAPAVRNPFWKPKAGDFAIPGVGNVAIGINELQDSGVMFCVCNVALTVNSAVMAKAMGLNAADVKKEWESNLFPGIQVMPSGLWAVGRAQEHGCTYCYAGG